ncbi:dolichyl-phosphate-mannose--protein mannosyltransferase [Nocardioides eburneiflavus]|uniref:dolichyl-phosphate-mannose--protein mannosyltransferase n=1 Tax=Nocardioides eburneiflavus TaxID=2518372 RepID=UPI001FE69986|nr:phospholipid carrier-dependent glycosyltransferase [Nocardioides eburneiflavus]
MTPTAAERNRPRWRSEDPVPGWLGAIALAGLAFFLRRRHIGTPHQFSFDETYYAKDAWSLLHHGYVRTYVEDADKTILNGNLTGLFADTPSMVVHPEVGKWVIASGIEVFGMDPAGWRTASAVVGALMVLVMCRFVRRVTGSTVLGLVAGLLLSIDGLQLVLSRLALLDIFLAFFLLCGVHCVVADRQWLRDRLASERACSRWLSWWRPWLLVGGVAFGLACGTKWSGAYTLAAFGLLAWLWSAGARRAFGERRPLLRSVLLDGVPAFVALVGVALATYVASWTGWLMHAEAYEEAFSNTQYTSHGGGDPWPTASEPDAEGLGEVTQSLRSLWSYHQDVYTFHSHFLDDSTHIYQSKPSTWLVMGRPVGVDAQTDIQPGSQGCAAPSGSSCIRQILLIGNPVIWWGGCLAMFASVLLWIGARDWRHGVAVVGLASTWLPWFAFDDRPIFLFYAITCLPFVVLSVVLAMGHLIGSSDVPTPRRTFGVVVAGSYTVLALIAFAWFWPIWTDELLTKAEWDARIWFQRWI